MKPTRNGSAGFVITLELLLVMVVFVLPLLLGMFLLGRKLVTLYLNHREFLEQPYSRAVVWDSSGTLASQSKVIGPVVGYDPFEAPIVIFRDSATKGGVALGVRPFRFTTFGEVFYTDPECTNNPRLRGWGADLATGKTGAPPPGITGTYLGVLLGYRPVGFMYQMQEQSYAMGNLHRLFRTSVEFADPVTTTSDDELFVWRSQDYSPPAGGLPSPPCFRVLSGTTVEHLAPANQVQMVIDFDDPGNYIAPFRVAFPSPGDPIAVPPSGGGD